MWLHKYTNIIKNVIFYVIMPTTQSPKWNGGKISSVLTIMSHMWKKYILKGEK